MSLAGQTSDSTSPTKAKMTCKGCKWTGTSLRTHLIRTKSSCKELYDMEKLKKESDELNKAKDAKRKYVKYHNNPEEAQRKKAAAKIYRYEHQEKITTAKKEYYKRKTTHLHVEKNSEHKMNPNKSDIKSIDETKITGIKDKSGIDDNKCPICERTFVLPRVKERHMEHFHSMVSNKISCDICEKAFEYKDNLTRHMREVHGGEKHKCDVCPATFTRNSDLQNHKETGQHYLAFYCCICCKQLVFKHLGGLVKHVVVKQSEEETPHGLKLVKSGILLTCKSHLESIQVEEGEVLLGMNMSKSAKLEAYKKRMRKKEEILNYGLRQAHGSREKPSVTLEFVKKRTHYQEDGKNMCKYCHESSPFKNVDCKERAEDELETIWTLNRNTEGSS